MSQNIMTTCLIACWSNAAVILSGKSVVSFQKVSGTRCLHTGHAIPLNYYPVVYGHGTGVPDVFHPVEIGRIWWTKHQRVSISCSSSIWSTILTLWHEQLSCRKMQSPSGRHEAWRDFKQCALNGLLRNYCAIRSATHLNLPCFIERESLRTLRSLMRLRCLTPCHILVVLPFFNYFP